MAAAYLFLIVSNHPFVDGNKRAGLLSALVFLDLNGLTIARPSDELYALTMDVAEGRLEKPAIAVELERIAKLNARLHHMQRQPIGVFDRRERLRDQAQRSSGWNHGSALVPEAEPSAA